MCGLLLALGELFQDLYDIERVRSITKRDSSNLR